jgi:hypothetical protein
MNKSKKILVIAPILVALVLLMIKIVDTAKNQGSSFDIYAYFEDNLDFTITIGIIVLQAFFSGLSDFLELKDPIPGKWDVEIIPTVWKGQSDAKVIGKGSMLLSKAPYSEKRYVGYLQLVYKNSQNTEIIRGLYEITFTLNNRKTLIGQSFMISRQHTKDATITDEPVMSWVRPCIYKLSYDKKHLELRGSANMESGNTKQQFHSYKSAN